MYIINKLSHDFSRAIWNNKDPKLLVFEKFTHAYLFQIALEIMWLPIQIRAADDQSDSRISI